MTLHDIIARISPSHLPSVAALARVHTSVLDAALAGDPDTSIRRWAESSALAELGRLSEWIVNNVRGSDFVAGELGVDVAIRLLGERVDPRAFAAALLHELADRQNFGWRDLHGIAARIREGDDPVTDSFLRDALARVQRGPVAKAVGDTIGAASVPRAQDSDRIERIGKALDHAFGSTEWRDSGGVVKAIFDLADRRYQQGRSDAYKEADSVLRAEQYAVGACAVATEIGWDGEGDPVAYARSYRESTDGYEAESCAFHSAMARLGIKLPSAVSSDDVVVDAFHTTIAERDRKHGYREHSITLHQIDHVIQRKDGPIPMEPFPSGADDGAVLQRVQWAIEGLDAVVSACGKMTSPPKRVVDRVRLVVPDGHALAVNNLLRRLHGAGIGTVEVWVGDQGTPARTGYITLVVRPEDRTADSFAYVRETGNRKMTVDEWLTGIEGRP